MADIERINVYLQSMWLAQYRQDVNAVDLML